MRHEVSLGLGFRVEMSLGSGLSAARILDFLIKARREVYEWSFQLPYSEGKSEADADPPSDQESILLCPLQTQHKTHEQHMDICSCGALIKLTNSDSRPAPGSLRPRSGAFQKLDTRGPSSLGVQFDSPRVSR